MGENTRNTKEGQNHQDSVEAPAARSEKIRYGAPDGPRPEGSENYDGHTPIQSPGLEAVAQYLAAPKSLRAFKSDNDLAEHFQVTRQTIHRWKHHPDVIKRVHWLSSCHRLAGDSLARISWPQIMKKVVDEAMKGHMPAIRFCEEIAWRQEKQSEKRETSPYSLAERLYRAEQEYEKNAEMMTPTWLKERQQRLAKERALVAADERESETEPVPAAVNACDACGNPRCAHGRCPVCKTCEVCV
jgi:hypothetical protein